ncbi:hypothetical protein TGME49_275795 [Toxoplasma gondii ME49]|uniref:Uncharacterized protein n=2 Tax=Toxoplasma gondii TaxID=5811 RepID=S8FAU7_TOXGM|nr:hypothetical protein TGME49_275795 [Toxoplasma gondii ME49]EPT31912.1 hypothetical protein TGME49_275795 [Toxoplasma gondii ME49]KYF38824.1 hypothetical protein TGARI_275795 [Toxoplasma gondii ARI]|eukprot:XP_018638235.1 hypothetical protein TGME49_275795 [Toxoplasma gondii ME49]
MWSHGVVCEHAEQGPWHSGAKKSHFAMTQMAPVCFNALFRVSQERYVQVVPLCCAENIPSWETEPLRPVTERRHSGNGDATEARKRARRARRVPKGKRPLSRNLSGKRLGLTQLSLGKGCQDCVAHGSTKDT